MSVMAATPARGRAKLAGTHGAADRWAPILLGALAGALVAGRFETAIGCAVVAGLGAAALGARRPGPKATLMLAASLATAIALNLYLVRGHALPLPRVFGLVPTREGLFLGALLGLRLLGAALAMRALAALWPGERAADELASRLRPIGRLGVPVERARSIVGLALRFAPLLGAESERITRLQTLRAGRPPRGARERLTRLRARVVPSLVAALERAEQLALALEARHHHGAPIRSSRWPVAASIGGALLFVVSLAWRG